MAFVLVLSLLPYIQCVQFSFVNWDDLAYLIDNPEVHDGLTRRSLVWSFTTFRMGNWHPLTWITYLIEISVFGMSPYAMHTTNVALHVLNTYLVMRLIRNWSCSPTVVLLTGLLFGLHPMHAEVVGWVSERKELLAVLFGLLSMDAWCRFEKNRSGWSRGLALLFFCLSLMSKQMLVTLPFLMVVLAVCPVRDGDDRFMLDRVRSQAWDVRYFFLLSVAFSACVLFAQRSAGAVVSVAHVPVPIRLGNAVYSCAMYLIQTILPVRLIPFYRHPFYDISYLLVGACGCLLLCFCVFVYQRRFLPGVVSGWLWFIGTLVPVIGLVQLGSAARADRYTYFPHIGLFLLFGRLLVSVWPNAERRVIMVLTIFAAVLIPVCYRQVSIWRDSVSLWGYCLEVDPLNYRARELLTLELLAQERIPEALESARRSLELPENRDAGASNTFYGLALLFSGRVDESIPFLRRGLEIRPDDFRALINLGYALRDRDLLEARDLFERALAVSPQSVEAMVNLANCEHILGNTDEAVRLLRDAARLAPDDTRITENLRLVLSSDSE